MNQGRFVIVVMVCRQLACCLASTSALLGVETQPFGLRWEKVVGVLILNHCHVLAENKALVFLFSLLLMLVSPLSPAPYFCIDY